MPGPAGPLVPNATTDTAGRAPGAAHGADGLTPTCLTLPAISPAPRALDPDSSKLPPMGDVLHGHRFVFVITTFNFGEFMAYGMVAAHAV